jgi:ABC-type bacteriocin/lantibiotic exporter with double-glycine peptidase domain
MKPVIQEEKTGCGIAAAATLAGVTYRQARRAAGELNISATDARLWSDSIYVRRLLAHFGIHAAMGKVKFVSWDRLPSTALLAIKWHREKGRAYWHWVVFWRGPQGPVVLDSKRSLRMNRRTDFGRMKPKWFIEVDCSTRPA